MTMSKKISGFSKLNKKDKIDWIQENFLDKDSSSAKIIKQYWHNNKKLQRIHDEFSENSISNYYLPFAIAPNFLINDKIYAVPMTIEESSVVAAASKSAKFWMNNGGFRYKVVDDEKSGQVHFFFNGDKKDLFKYFKKIKPLFFSNTEKITEKMNKRGGGIKEIKLIDKTKELNNYFQIFATFTTADAMGANFINTCLEKFAETLTNSFKLFENIKLSKDNFDINMSILSNYVPKCLVKVEVQCEKKSLDELEPSIKNFSSRIVDAIKIANNDTYRAVTHNKGIMNGIDAVAIATGNDFRAIEAGAHAYASSSGKYKSLSNAIIKGGVFKYSLKVPIAIGTVGGVTNLHPLVKIAHNILGKPTSKELMGIMGSVGLAQNFGALRSLVTTGIQKGHMKMHLSNLLNKFGTSKSERKIAIEYFKNKIISYSGVEKLINKIRGNGF